MKKAQQVTKMYIKNKRECSSIKVVARLNFLVS